ncbi:hypothetical protein CJF25_14890 [Photobacterium phosphoreum]|uniref:hypothetical protein n=1 Tax=Photobacterium phosphoreum TaxID=659 RepID=UPI001E6129DD|nr:hypothetical protein [Photobacterium phosphoreum]MCD9464258.1 hypothetical protein [Photobacterium phosphoreum]
MRISGRDAVKILEKVKSKVVLYRKDNTDKFWSYKLVSGSRSEFAFDPTTKTKLVVRFDQLPPSIVGITDVNNIVGDSVSTALGRVFTGGKYKAKYTALVETEEALLLMISVLK